MPPVGTSSTADGKFDLHASEERVNQGGKANRRCDAVTQVTLAED